METDTRIKVIGTIFGQTGYDSHTRQLANALNEQDGIDVIIECQKPVDWLRKVSDAELKMLDTDMRDYDVNLMIGLPLYWPNYFCDDKPFIGFCVWEGDKVPAYWMDILLDIRVDQIWVPSQHTKDAIFNTASGGGEASVLTDKIKVVPHGIDLSLFAPEEKEDKSKFTFIANKGYRGIQDRGGLQYLFKAFNEEFENEEPVELVVKINGAYGIVNFDHEFDVIGMEKGKADVKLITDNVDYKDMKAFYNMGDVFVTTSQAEAYNLPCIEAMACGRPVIATSFGGQADFVTEENGWLLTEGTMKENVWDLMYEGISWKEPSISEIRTTLRMVYENKEEVTTKGKISYGDSLNHTWEMSAIKAANFIKEIKK